MVFLTLSLFYRTLNQGAIYKNWGNEKAISTVCDFVNEGRFYSIFVKVENIFPYFRVLLNSVFGNLRP